MMPPGGQMGITCPFTENNTGDRNIRRGKMRGEEFFHLLGSLIKLIVPLAGGRKNVGQTPRLLLRKRGRLLYIPGPPPK
jgi:hypothetical protein